MNPSVWLLSCALALSGCGYKFSQKQIVFVNDKGEPGITAYSCGSYMQVSLEGWNGSTYEVIWTDNQGLLHDSHGAKGVVVSDIPERVDAPMWGFTSDPYPEMRYSEKPDGTPGELIKEGDVVVRGDSQARLRNGKWVPVRVQNPACLAFKPD